MRVPYTKRTYEEIREELVRQIPEISNRWTDFNPSDPGMVILDALAAIADMLNFSIDWEAGEAYLSSLERRRSVEKLSKIVGYVLRRPSPALVTVRFYVDSPLFVDIPIGIYTPITVGNDNLKFLTLTNATIAAGNTYVDVPCAQVERVVQNIISNGQKNQRIELGPSSEVTGDFSSNLLGVSLYEKSSIVYVNGELWEKVESFIDNPEKAYIEEESEDHVYVVFGDGVFGAVPPSNATIEIRHFTTSGAVGNLPAASIVGVITLTDASGQVEAVNFKALENATGGEDQESVLEAKRNIPAYVRSLERCVTRSDWIANMERFPGVLRANAWGEEYEHPANYDMFNRVKVTFIPSNSPWQQPSQALVDAVVADLNDKKVITTKITFVAPVFVEFDLVIDVLSTVDVSTSLVQNAVRSNIIDMFAYGQYNFDQDLYHSDIVARVEAVPGVNSCFVKIKCEAKGVDNFTSTDLYSKLYEIFKLRDLTVNVQTVTNIR